MTSVSVIIPTFNRASRLPYAIASLVRQATEVDLDILVIDDGSTDDTPAVLSLLEERHTNVRSIRQENAGAGAARNTGLANLPNGCELITFLDSDDLSPAGRLAADLSCIAVEPDLELTYGRMMVVDEIDPQALEPAEGARRVEFTGIQVACGIYRRRLIERVGEFEPDMPAAEDTDFLLRLFEADATYRQTQTICLYYLRHQDNISIDKPEIRRGLAKALRRSMLGRKADPSIVFKRPEFDFPEMAREGLWW